MTGRQIEKQTVLGTSGWFNSGLYDQRTLAAWQIRHDSEQQELFWQDRGGEAPHFLQRVIQGDLPPGAAFIPAGRAGHGDGRHAAGPATGQ